MTGKRTDSKSDRALELFEKGIDKPTICERLGIGPNSIRTMLRCARAKREKEIFRAGKLADIIGNNV